MVNDSYSIPTRSGEELTASLASRTRTIRLARSPRYQVGFVPGAVRCREVITVVCATRVDAPEQIDKLQLPTRPTKRSDTRSRGFKGESVEVDAIPPAQLRELAETCILRHIDPNRLEALHLAERSEREGLLKIAGENER